MAEGRDSQARAQRATRILDAAADLLLRHGYHRVTIEDVARRAHIGKGTVYLHWRTREQLFTAVLVREVAAAFDEVADVFDTDPDSWRIHRVARAFYLAITRRPLLAAMVRSDPEVLGRLNDRDLHQRYGRRVGLLDTYFATLTEHGLLRTDLSIEDLSLAFRATAEGFLLIDLIEQAAGRTPDTLPTDPYRLADLLGATVRAAFESGSTVPPHIQASLRRTLAEQLRAVAAADRADLNAGTVPAPSSPGH